jgi:hypothetical protein
MATLRRSRGGNALDGNLNTMKGPVVAPKKNSIRTALPFTATHTAHGALLPSFHIKYNSTVDFVELTQMCELVRLDRENKA